MKTRGEQTNKEERSSTSSRRPRKKNEDEKTCKYTKKGKKDAKKHKNTHSRNEKGILLLHRPGLSAQNNDNRTKGL
jgi:hypothetical protein